MTVKITVFSDYICPFCYIANALLTRLKQDFDVKINWCFLETHPETSAASEPITDLAYGEERWQQLPMGKPAFTTNSHQSLLLAEATKRLVPALFYPLHEALFHALFVNQLNIGDMKVLRNIAKEVGINSSIVEKAWEDTRFEKHLENYRKAARRFNVNSTPTFFLGEERIDGIVDFKALSTTASQSSK